MAVSGTEQDARPDQALRVSTELAPPPRPLHRDAVTLLALLLLVAGSAVFIGQAYSASMVYLVCHVVAVTVWVGGGAALGVLGALTERARDPRALTNLVHQVARIGPWVFTPASLVTLGTGIGLIATGHIGYDHFWIDFALVVWALSFLTGLLFLGPTSGRLSLLIPERGLGDSQTARALSTLLRIARLDTAMLLLVVVDMVVRPAF
jgi:uncharacterized membrane protein